MIIPKNFNKDIYSIIDTSLIKLMPSKIKHHHPFYFIQEMRETFGDFIITQALLQIHWQKN
jgi:hypothetical protein